MSPKTPEVTVLLPVYNAGAYLKDAVQSILDQTYRDFELLIINDASTDKSAEVIKSFSDPRIRVLTNPTNLGLIATLNKGLGAARGQYLARMDQDDISAPTRLEKQRNYMKENPNVTVVGTAAIIIDPAGKHLSREAVLEENDILQRALAVTNIFFHGSVMLKNNVLLEVGGYSDTAYLAEDYDAWVRLGLVGTMANIQEPLYYWRSHGGGMSNQNLTKQQKKASELGQKVWARFAPDGPAPAGFGEIIVRGAKRKSIGARKKYSLLFLQFSRSYFLQGDRKVALRNAIKAIRILPSLSLPYFYLVSILLLPPKLFLAFESQAVRLARKGRGY